MNKQEQLIEKQRELIEKLTFRVSRFAAGNMRGHEDTRSRIIKLESEISALESEIKEKDEPKTECECNSNVIGSYARCPIHNPDVNTPFFGNTGTVIPTKDEPKMSADKSSFIITTADRIDGILGSNPNSIHPGRIEGYQFRECIRLLAKQVDILFERNRQFKQ